uniref:Uncharacterized protein n=1 Tax=Arcella intermedia TaxID=1963864 RepID=A0A6B2LBY1_9EUKA
MSSATRRPLTPTLKPSALAPTKQLSSRMEPSWSYLLMTSLTRFGHKVCSPKWILWGVWMAMGCCMLVPLHLMMLGVTCLPIDYQMLNSIGMGLPIRPSSGACLISMGSISFSCSPGALWGRSAPRISAPRPGRTALQMGVCASPPTLGLTARPSATAP